jgi:cell division protein FtsQ
MVAGLAAVASLAVGAIAVVNSSWLDVERVEVVGAVRADPQQVITASAIEVGEPLVEVDLDLAVEGVLGVPWVAEAEIDRGWRGLVQIHIVERVGMAALPTGQRFAIVDRTGYQLEVVTERPEGFLPISGVEASGVPGQPLSDEGESVIALLDAMTPVLEEVGTEIVVVDGQVMLGLATGGRANFGDERQLEAKIVALETVLARVDLQCVDTIDLRVPEAPTVSRATPGVENQEPLAGTGGC